jgi:hypothetical protein
MAQANHLMPRTRATTSNCSSSSFHNPEKVFANCLKSHIDRVLLHWRGEQLLFGFRTIELDEIERIEDKHEIRIAGPGHNGSATSVGRI